MALRIETFDNARGGNTLYKALTHPHAAPPGRALVAALAARPPTAIVDPLGGAEGFAEIFGLARVQIAGIYVQDIACRAPFDHEYPKRAITHLASRTIIDTHDGALSLPPSTPP